MGSCGLENNGTRILLKMRMKRIKSTIFSDFLLLNTKHKKINRKERKEDAENAEYLNNIYCCDFF